MIVWSALAGGAIGTIVLTSVLRISQEAGLTRMDLPLLLGSIFVRDRSKASLAGLGVHFVFGLLFSLAYAGIFWAVGNSTWWFGALLGAAHAALAGGMLVTVVLPAVHPRMGTPWTDATQSPLLEPPGFLLHNYGRTTAAVTLLAHILYGAIVGWFAGGL